MEKNVTLHQEEKFGDRSRGAHNSEELLNKDFKIDFKICQSI